MRKETREAIKKIDGKLETIKDRLIGEDSEKFAKELDEFLMGRPCHVEGMIYQPLVWSEDLGEVSEKSLEKYIAFHNGNRKEDGDWRLPTDLELSRALRAMKPAGFSVMIYYWSSTLSRSGARQITYNHGGGLGSSDGSMGGCNQKHPHLRLCREIKFLEQP